MEDRYLKRLVKEVNRDPLKKYILFLLHSDCKAPIVGKTKFMKELFLVAKNIPPLEDKADFEPDNYGPNSEAAANVLEELSLLGLVNKKQKKYEVSTEGEEILNEVDHLTDNETVMINFVKNLLNDLNYDEILTLVYFNYPEMTTESFVKDKIVSKRKHNALSLLKKNKISKTKAAEIYGVPLRDFYKILNNKGISIELV